MSRNIKLTKTSTNKITKLQNSLYKSNTIEDVETFINNITNIILSDVKLLKECSEKSIVDFYIDESLVLLNNGLSNDFFDVLKSRVRSKLAKKYTSSKTFDNNIDIYFNEVKREYILCPQNESDNLEFLPENRDIFIKNNLKLVIDCAKRYQNLGLPFEDLIQIGNCGLLVAFDKFDKDRANLRFAILNDVEKSSNTSFTISDAEEIIRKNFSYSKNLDATLKKLPASGFSNKEEFKQWVKTNVKTAVFASVAFQWIRAYIIVELNRLGKIIRIPKSAQKDGEITPIIINLDSINPHTDDCYHDNQISDIANEEFAIEDETMENMERQDLFKGIINSVLFKLNVLDRRIIKKRFGIDMPYQLSVSEIAESEGLSTNKVKYSLTSSFKLIAENISVKDKNMIQDLLR